MWVLYAAILAACLQSQTWMTNAYYFESGYSHHYTYWAENSQFGIGQQNVTTVLKLHIFTLNETSDGHRLQSLVVDSLVQFIRGGGILNNPLKWNLTKAFLFTTNDNGTIILVHCHPEDHEELLLIKKALVSVFSVQVKIEEDADRWEYSTSEMDHLGHLPHNYTAERTVAGIRLTRSHYSNDDAHRFHEKTLHYDQSGTLNSAETKDRILLRNINKSSYKQDLQPGEIPHKIITSGDFPDIEAAATVIVTLDSKTKRNDKPTPTPELFHNLTAEQLIIKPKPIKMTLEQVKNNITAALNCIDKHPDKEDVNRSLCVNGLRAALQKLHGGDYRLAAEDLLQASCKVNDTLCEDRYLVIIDVVARMGDVISQDLIVKYVLSKDPPVIEQLRRVFIHCVVLEHPTKNLVKSVENFCFGKDGEHHGSRSMDRIQTRACLALGSLTKHLAKGGRIDRAIHLADLLETWLEKHGEGDPHISKRDTYMTDTVHEAHHLSKAVLLHALGNAALLRSKQHLLSHAEPNRGHHIWRRAALDALRHYDCLQSANAALNSILNDETYSVRRVALAVYIKHPQRREASREQENNLLSKNYTYPAVARVKRSLLDKVLFQFNIGLPKVDWKKMVGSNSVGASFGVYFENGIQAMFKILNSYVDINVHDKVWADVHLGVINKHINLLLIEVCYKGRLSYNLNLYKDFTVGLMNDISGEFDRISRQLIEPLKNTVTNLASNFQDAKTGLPKSGFSLLSDAVQQLPFQSKLALNSTIAFVNSAEVLNGLPLIGKIQQLSSRALTLVEDVHAEATNLFANVGDAAVVALPFAEKEIRDSLNTVLKTIGHVTEAPNQVFFAIENGKMGFQLAMQRVLEGSNIIKEATSFLSGSKAGFMNSGNELLEIMQTTKDFIQKLKADHHRRKRSANRFDEFGQTIASHVDQAVDDLIAKSEAMEQHLFDLIQKSPRPLHTALDSVFSYTDLLKNGFESFKRSVETIRSRIKSLFGQKFHDKFPDQRRECEDTCGCGFYPTDVARYGHPGVDLVWNPSWKVVSPVAGLIYPYSSNAVRIEPATSGFQEYEIILSNIQLTLNINSSGTFVSAGEAIGTTAGNNGCKESHFNVAVRRKTTDDSGTTAYIDPSQFLGSLSPLPKWHEECKELNFKHIGQVIDFHKLTDGFAKLLKVLMRVALDVGKQLLIEVVDALPDIGFVSQIKAIAKEIVSKINLDPANLKNFVKDGINAVKNFFNNISSQNFDLKKIVDLATKFVGNSSSLMASISKVTDLIQTTKDFLKKPSLNGIATLATGSLGRLLSSRNLNFGSGSGTGVGQFMTSFIGGRSGQLVAVKASVGHICPDFAHALADVTHATCMPHDDCLGIDCKLTFKNMFISGNLDFKLRIHPELLRVDITIGNQKYSYQGNYEQKISTGLKVLQVFDIAFKLQSTWQGNILHLSIKVTACAFDHCLPDIPLIRNLHLNSTARRRQSLDNFEAAKSFDVDSLSIGELMKAFSDSGLDMKDVADQYTGIMQSISTALKTNDFSQRGWNASAEFVNPVDFKDHGSYPPRMENGEINLLFFKFTFAYPVSFILLQIDIAAGGALGFKTEVNVQALDAAIKTVLNPWVAGKIEGRLSISIIIAKAGVELTGYILKTGFPLTISSPFSKQPVVNKVCLDVELIPLEVILKAFVEILFGLIKFKVVIWHWAAPPIRGNIFCHQLNKIDQGPPVFKGLTHIARRSVGYNSDGNTCSISQVSGRHPNDPAFRLEFDVSDDDSDLKLWYAIGTYKGGRDVQEWAEIRGGLHLKPSRLPCGVPLYFTVKARNSQGLEAFGQCSIPTYDCTFPDGRVEELYRCTSHPSKLGARVIIYDDSVLKNDGLFYSVGHSPSSYGHKVLERQPMSVSATLLQKNIAGDLASFSSPRPGRLQITPKKSVQISDAEKCASECLKLQTCLAFTYSRYTKVCELQERVEGSSVKRIEDDFHETFEKLGKSQTTILHLENLRLHQGTKYYINTDIENKLGYISTLSSGGTMVDFTPPKPGPVLNIVSDKLVADGCQASIIQRCEEADLLALNHRKIVDGPGSRTVFNGNKKGSETIYTSENYQASANWDGFKDEECGIFGYTWAVGSQVCGSDIVPFNNPHSHLRSSSDWTYTGLTKHLQLTDGKYYVTVQAVSDILHGGDLVTTVCHATPIIVDTTTPFLNSVNEVLFDETFRYLVVYYSASDNVSGIARMELGLGKTKYDVMIRKYLPNEIHGEEGNTYLVNEEFETASGVPAWIRLKVVNNVDLLETGYANAPILLDSTAPIAGHLLDGSDTGRDRCCQLNTTQICIQINDFLDPESNIESYSWGVGLSPGKDDIVAFHRLSSFDKESCFSTQLMHNTTYFSTVIAYNKALNQKSVNSTSDGVLVDVTPPLLGIVSDGKDVQNDENFTSETATIMTSWAGFVDWESGVDYYTISIFVNNILVKTVSELHEEQFIDHSFSFQHGDYVHVSLMATNRAGGEVVTSSDGVLVDHTPPQLGSLSTANKTLYQQQDSSLEFSWEFEDSESGIKEYRCIIYEHFHGQDRKFWPVDDYYLVSLNQSSSAVQYLKLEGLQLQNGGEYRLKVTAVNQAKLATSKESQGVIVDISPPDIIEVSLSRPGEEEEVNSNNEVEHVDSEPLPVRWIPHDSESGIEKTVICISLAHSPNCLASPLEIQTIEGSSSSRTVFNNLNLQVSTDDIKVRYQAYLVAFNQAGFQSAVYSSKPFIVLKASIAGRVLDGRQLEDEDYSNDKASVAMSFSGFSSEACGIEGYEWAVGTEPLSSNVMPYSSYGLVVDEQGFGYAQAHIIQLEEQMYYTTVRARTGPNCNEKYIVASSDGYRLDTTPPRVLFKTNLREISPHEAVYQTNTNKLAVTWKGIDISGLNDTRITQHSFEASSLALSFDALAEELPIKSTPVSGSSIYTIITMTDKAGNKMKSMFPVVTFDFSPPSLTQLACTEAVSDISPLVTCTWTAVQEAESVISLLEFGIGNGPSIADLMNLTSLPFLNQRWSVDTSDMYSHDTQVFYIIIHMMNSAGLKTELSLKVLRDSSPPLVNLVSIVTSHEAGYHAAEQQCQIFEDYMEVLVWNASDPESNVSSIEIALGSSKGRSDIKSFGTYPLVNGIFIMSHLDLKKGSKIFATVRVMNTVGLYTMAESNGIFISPEPRLEVTDGPADADIDSQFDTKTMQGSWKISEPCPVLSAEWSVREIDDLIITNFAAIPDNGHFFYNDMLRLTNFKTYVNYIKVRDALNRTLFAFSDGVTVSIRKPDTAFVRDGLGAHDQTFQEAVDHLSANWNDFGNKNSTFPWDKIIKYEAAVGTDRFWYLTRSNIHAFQDIGLATNVTFFGLNLTAKTVTYYITVRAYSAAGSYIETSSDGIKVGYSSEIKPGEVMVDKYQSSTLNIRASWSEFLSNMEIVHYYAGVSTFIPSALNQTYKCSDQQGISNVQFDASALKMINSGSSNFMTVIEDLSLQHAGRYYVTVIAVNQAGMCSAAVSQPLLVDTTPVTKGEISAEGTNRKTVIFLHSASTVVIDLSNFYDLESGLEKSVVDLLINTGCDLTDHNSHLIYSVTAVNETRVTIHNLNLLENQIYFAKVSITNGAGLEMQAISKPLLLDAAPPVVGVVKLSVDWTLAEMSSQNQTHTVQGMLAVKSQQSRSGCPSDRETLSAEFQLQWYKLSHPFSESCVGFDRSYLHILVRHNPYLSGVDRGAVQFNLPQWLEGNYTFQLLVPNRRNILFGFAIASANTRPPFFDQNAVLSGSDSTIPCELLDDNCTMDKMNISRDGYAMPAERDEYGIGLSFFNRNEKMNVLFWAQDSSLLKQKLISLDFDPGTVLGDYTLNLMKSKEGNDDKWDISLYVDGIEKARFSGFSFHNSAVITLYGWNINDYFPEVVDSFQPFKAVAVVSSITVPVIQKPLCSYGTAFYDSNSGIREIWAGVSDGFNKTANVASYRLMKTFCLPCLMQCENLCFKCAGESLVEDYRILHVSINKLTLMAANDVVTQNGSLQSNNMPSTNETRNGTSEQTSKLPVYYLDVLIVDHAGLVVEAKSKGIIVDTSPPVVNYIHCFDPVNAPDESRPFIGNNHTVRVEWDVTEDVSSISEIWISLGAAEGLDDIVLRHKIEITPQDYVFTEISPTLQDGHLYFVNLEVVNVAGLHTMVWANFTVFITPPNISAMTVNMTVQTFSGQQVGFLENTKHIELDLASPGTDVEFYEFSIGSSKGSDDLLPRTRIGSKNMKKILIHDGFVQLDGAPSLISIGDYASRNISTQDLPNPNANKFKVEPGRCITPRLFALNKAYVPSSIDITPACIKRPEDILVEGDDAICHLQLNGTSFIKLNSSSSSKTNKLSIKFKLSKGALMVGAVTSTNLNENYGSSASTEFTPFIVHPEFTKEFTSRVFKKRLSNIPGPHTFISPIAASEFSDDILFTYSVPGDIDVSNNSRVSLMFWVAELKIWMFIEEVCPSNVFAYDNITRVLTGSLCPKIFTNLSTLFEAQHFSPMESQVFGDHSLPAPRAKRSATPTANASFVTLGPRMLTVAVIKANMVNTPPSVKKMSLSVIEDQGFTFNVDYADAEDDAMNFKIAQQSLHGTATVLPNGTIQYAPDPNYTGQDVIYIVGIEVLSPSALTAGIIPSVINFTITVNVTNINDPPDIFYLPAKETEAVTQDVLVGLVAGNGLNMSILIEGNTTTSTILGTIVFNDNDPNDTLQFLEVHHVDKGAQFEVVDINISYPLPAGNNTTRSSVVHGKRISLNLPSGYSGRVTYETRAKDSNGMYSLQLTLGVHVLISPCLHGHCQPKLSSDSCRSPKRAFTFQPFICRCDLGYEDEWCRTETDECRQTICSPITDCIDLVGGYRCDANSDKLAAITLCCAVAVVLAIVAFFKLKKRSSKVGDYWFNMKETLPPSTDSSTSIIPKPVASHTTSEPEHTTQDQDKPTPGTSKDFLFNKDSYFQYHPSTNPTLPVTNVSATERESVVPNDERKSSTKQLPAKSKALNVPKNVGLDTIETGIQLKEITKIDI